MKVRYSDSSNNLPLGTFAVNPGRRRGADKAGLVKEFIYSISLIPKGSFPCLKGHISPNCNVYSVISPMIDLS